ncbi:hypothetical protein JQM83_09180 [Parabacteroides distasonis]|nr:hypothetical protein [Parabacteroides distasonis]
MVQAFKKAVFVAVDKERIYNDPVTGSSLPIGLGYRYATFTGKELLEATDRQVSVENAVFIIGMSSIQHLYLMNPYAYFPTKEGIMSDYVPSIGSGNDETYSFQKGIRPFIYQDNLTGSPMLMTAPANGHYVWTQIGFSTDAGIIPSDSFKDKTVSVSIADKEVRKSGTDAVATDVLLENWKIYPNSTTQKSGSGEDITYTNRIQFCQAADLLANHPEDCWTLTKGEDDFFLLQNRESAQSISLGKIIYQDGENLYRLATPLEGDCQGQSVKIDSLRLIEVKLGELDGYAHSKEAGDSFDKATLASTPYKLGVLNAAYDGSVMYATAYNGTMAVTSKQDEGLSLVLTPCDTVPYGVYTVKDDKRVYDLKRVRYALQDQNSGCFLKYDLMQSLLVLDTKPYTSVPEALSAATQFYLKDRGFDQYELIVSQGYYDATNYNQWVETGGNLKVYTNTQGNLSAIQLYAATRGDKFGLFTKQSTESTDNILNKLIGKSDTTLVRLNFLSTMNGSGSQPWMLAVDADRFLVEGQPIRKPNIDIDTKAQGGLEYEPVNFSLILDTAYVQRAGVTTPLYYIAMPSDKTSEQIQQVGKKTVGYYLFAMTDSIHNSVDKNREDRYCYHFWSQHNPRLRFVQATHEGDTIYIETANPSAKDTIQAGSTEGVALAARQRAWLAAQSEGTAGNPQNNTNKGINYGLFAFEANPKAAEGSLEYALWNPASNRYVTYLNGNVVLTQEPTYYKLDVSRPGEGHFVVANEPVVAEPEPFAVVGGIGQVEIRQAAGKQVHIYNILGKELAHRRLTSDREQIALPKGIAIVAVEGETPVKAIVQ